MSVDHTLEMMNAQRKQTVESENAKTIAALTQVLSEQIQLAYAQLQEEDKKLLNPTLYYNQHSVDLCLKLNLKDIHTRLPDGEYYRIYWQPSTIKEPQAMEAIIRKYSVSTDDPNNVLGKLLTTCSLPILEQFRQHLRQRYPGAIISSHYNGAYEPSIGIHISYKFEYQQGIPVMLHPKRTSGGGVVWSTETIQQQQF